MNKIIKEIFGFHIVNLRFSCMQNYVLQNVQTLQPFYVLQNVRTLQFFFKFIIYIFNVLKYIYILSSFVKGWKILIRVYSFKKGRNVLIYSSYTFTVLRKDEIYILYSMYNAVRFLASIYFSGYICFGFHLMPNAFFGFCAFKAFKFINMAEGISFSLTFIINI